MNVYLIVLTKVIFWIYVLLLLLLLSGDVNIDCIRQNLYKDSLTMSDATAPVFFLNRGPVTSKVRLI